MKVVIEAVPAREVEHFSRREEENRAADGSLVIYPKRATALANNPDAQPDDPVLLLAKDGARCVGYLGLVWDRLSFRGVRYRWAWGTQFYVVPEYRLNPFCALLLVKKAKSLAAGLGAWGMAPDASRIFERFGAWPPFAVSRFHASRLESAADPLARRAPLLRRLLDPLKRLEERPIRAWTVRLLDEQRIRAEPTTRADPSVDRLAEVADDGAYFVRTRARLDWLLRFPWVTRNGEELDEPWTNRPYFWTRVRPRHDLELLTLSSPDLETKGYALVCHTQQNHREASRTCLLDWGWDRADDRAFEIAVAIAVECHLRAKTHKLEIYAAERLRGRAESIPGLRATGPALPLFFVCCPRKSELISGGLQELAAGRWRVGGAEGDHLPMLF